MALARATRHRFRGTRVLGPLLACLCLPLAAGVSAAAHPVELVLGSADSVRAWRIFATESQELAVPASAPLGSLWKLFVYAYLVDRGIQAPDYQCTGGNPRDEAYCCAIGETIDRDHALAKSCGLYFSP